MKKAILFVTIIYIGTLILGLNAGSGLIWAIERGVIPPAVENPESVSSSGHFFLYIMLMTAVLLVLIKLGLNWIIRLIMVFAIFSGSLFSMMFVFREEVAFLAAVFMALVVIFAKLKGLINSALVVSVSGIGALLGASLFPAPAYVLFAAMAVYDIIAVFGTKHMVTLAKSDSSSMFLFEVPADKRPRQENGQYHANQELGEIDSIMHLGTGDIMMPLVFSVSLLHTYPVHAAVFAGLGGLCGIIWIIAYSSRKDGAVLPALPPVLVGASLGFLAGILV